MESNPTAYKNFTLVHQLKRRIRIIAPILKNDPERGYIFEILLKKRIEIKRVRSVFDLGSVVIEFDPGRLPKANLLILLDAVLGNLGRKPSQSLLNASKKTELTGKLNEIDLAVEGMSCASCALLLEMVIKRDARVKQVSVNFATETLSVVGQLSRDEVSSRVASLGYKAFPMDTLSQRKKMIEKEQQRIVLAKHRLVWSALLSAPVIAIAMSMTTSRRLHWVQLVLATPVVFWAGKPFFDKAFRLAKHRAANMDSLIALGVGSAFLYSLPAFFLRKGHLYFEAAAAIITFVLLGRYLEEQARGKAGEAIRQLVDLQPQTATLLRDGEEFIVDAESLQINDLVLIRPGEKISADGVVYQGMSTVDESMVTGESMPVIKEAGHRVIAGCINGNGVLRIKVTAVGMDTVLAGIVHMVDQAQSTKLPIQKHVDKISAVFVPGVMVVSGLTLVGWLLAGASFGFAFGNAITVLLIACPCALGLATPAAIMVGTGQAAKKGIYIRNGESLEVAAKLNVIVFDKTGTITEGKPKVSDMLNVSDLTQESLLTLAASAEHDSEHFLAKAIVDYAREQSVSLEDCQHFYSETGLGIRADIGQNTVLLGNKTWLLQQAIAVSALLPAAQEFAGQGKTPVFMAVNGKEAAVFGIADNPKENAKAAIAKLHKLGIETVMATGDIERTAQYIAAKVGIEQLIANARPEKKLAIIQELQAQGKQVGMIGDGINDAPALTAANVGFAIGCGNDIAIESADLTLVQGDISKVADAIGLSKETIVIIKQNLFWAFAYNTVAIPVAAMGRLNPMLASAAMALSSVSVIVNSLRLSRR
ncbi:MAG: heavy metal translocating P-type ATPase [Methylovulum sp.]|jgi:Cu+-exporting ATPase|nr:heavy metal translocating P-type ATPase [Methylovulum sp.]MCF7998082.1 heavy metal translocating P-type ATPase [Methylovulum sp.]